jgi:hypothetical protein
MTEQIGVWRRRAEKLRAENESLTRENGRLREDNTTLSTRLVDLAIHPPAPPFDMLAVLEQFRKTVQPDLPDTPERAGINWSDQGLDNTGGTPSHIPDLFDGPLAAPDYVLDIESLTADQVKGTRGGWYNPPSPSRPETNPR